MYVSIIKFTDGTSLEGHLFITRSEHPLFKDYISVKMDYGTSYDEILYRIDTIAEVYVSKDQNEEVPFKKRER